jgi:hypothetical protein
VEFNARDLDFVERAKEKLGYVDVKLTSLPKDETDPAWRELSQQTRMLVAEVLVLQRIARGESVSS